MNADSPLVSGKFVTSYDTGRTWYDARDAQTQFNLGIQLGTEAGKSVSIHCPNVEITNVQQIGSEGLLVQEVSWQAYEENIGPRSFNQRTYTSAPSPSPVLSTANQTNLYKSAMKITFG